MNLGKKIWFLGSPSYDTDAAAFFARVLAGGSSVSDSYKIAYSNVVTYLKSTKGNDAVTSLWDSLDFIRIVGADKTSYLYNIRQNLFNATIFNDYGGSSSAGWVKGNGTNFRIMTGFNPTVATYKFLQNDASIGLGALTDEAGQFMDVCALNAGATQGTYIAPHRDGIGTNHFRYDGSINATLTSPAWTTVLNTIGCFEIRKTASGNSSLYVNGVLVTSLTGQTNNLLNLEFAEFCASVNGAFSQFSSKKHTYIFGGNSNLDSNKIHTIIQNQFYKPLGLTGSTVNKRVIFVGDSMTGDTVNYSLSNVSQFPRTTMTALGASWCGTQIGVASVQLGATEYVSPSLQTAASTKVTPYRNTGFDKDIIVLRAGTNDIAGNATTTGSIAYTRLVTLCNTYKAAGFKVIVVGCIARNGSFLNLQNAAGFLVGYQAFNNLLLADFTGSTGISNVTYPAGGITYADAFINLAGDSRYTDETNTTYFNADKVHQTSTADDLTANTYVAPTIQLL